MYKELERETKQVCMSGECYVCVSVAGAVCQRAYELPTGVCQVNHQPTTGNDLTCCVFPFLALPWSCHQKLYHQTGVLNIGAYVFEVRKEGRCVFGNRRMLVNCAGHLQPYIWKYNDCQRHACVWTQHVELSTLQQPTGVHAGRSGHRCGPAVAS